MTLCAADRPIERGTRARHTANSSRAVGSVVVPSGSIDGSSSALDLCSSTTKAAPTSQGGEIDAASSRVVWCQCFLAMASR